MAAYNLATLRASVRKRLKDDEFPNVDDLINDAYYEIVGEDKYPFFERSVEDIAITNPVTLPEDYQSVFLVMMGSMDAFFVFNSLTGHIADLGRCM
jgi:hypothetical protein